MALGRLAARAVIGGLFIGHGTQKLFGTFGGPGLQGTEQMMAALDMQPTKVNAYAAGVTETAGGAGLLLGYRTPLACAGLIGTMITAVRKVHLKNGFFNANGGYEYNLALIGALAALAETGPGALSLDKLRGKEHKGVLWALGTLAAGAAASTAVIELGARQAAARPSVLPTTDEGTYPSESMTEAVAEGVADPVVADQTAP